MLRPATPLSVVLFAAFALLLLSVLSTPVITAIPLGTYNGANFGVFGYCKASGDCSSIGIGYDASDVGSDSSSAFDLPGATRNTLTSVLVIHPVAAFMTLVMFGLAVASHFRSPSHSSRYLLVVFIVSVVNFLVCLLAFLVDVLVFIPHMAWGSYIVLAATILAALSSIVSCAMRRTVVGRKARERRIAENAEMSGENFFNRQAQQSATMNVTSSEPIVPSLSGANGGADGGDKLPQFAAFEKKDDRSSDERVPLTARSPSQRSQSMANESIGTSADMSPMGPGGLRAPPRSNPSPPVQFDQYGNPIRNPRDGYGVRRGPSTERMNARGRGGMPPGGYRGRGGYGPGPGPRGGYNGYGPPPNSRGGYGPSPRGAYGPAPGARGGYAPRGYGAPGMRGGRPPPPSGYQNEPGPYDRRSPPTVGYAGPYGRQPSPGASSAPGYMNQSNPSISAGSYEAYNPDRDSLPRAESPPPLPAVSEMAAPGTAVELDAITGSSAQPPPEFGQYGARDSNNDAAGTLPLQQTSGPSTRRHETYMSEESSRYSQEESTYVPPRQAWNQGTGRSSPRMPSPLNAPARTAEFHNRGSPGPQQPLQAGEYYEDVDPRFAEPSATQRPTPPPLQTTNAYEGIP